MNKFSGNNRESGQVAIISVMFFMILFSIIVVSFMRTVIAEQRQTTNNELSASALAAAESGVEDAKRILTYCNDNPTTTECQAVFNPSINDCNSIIGNSVLMSNKLKSTVVDVSGSKQVVVSADGNEKYQQYYTCLKIKYFTRDYVGSATQNGKSIIIPLDFVDSAGQPVASAAYFSASWHSTSVSGNGPVLGLDNSSNLPTVQVWKNSGNRPAVLRMELVTVPKGGFTLNQITDDARAVTLRPGTQNVGGTTVNTGGNNKVYQLDHWKQRTGPNLSQTPIMRVDCTTTNQSYACWNTSFTVGATNSLNLAANYYYLRVQAIYNDADFSITANDSSGNPLYFNGVQPSVDVTGRANDAFKRLGNRLTSKLISDNSALSWWPEYALESGEKICKNMTVREENGTDNCAY